MTALRKNTTRVFLLFCAAILPTAMLPASAADAPAWTSGEPIPVGTAARRGPLSVGLTSFPVGYAHVTGAKQPDLFAVAGRFSPEPGLYLYPWKATTAGGVPVFGERQAVRHPAGNLDRPVCTIVEESGMVWGFFVQENEIIHTRFDKAKREFVETKRQALSGLPRAPQAIAALPCAGGGWLFVMSVSDGNSHSPAGAGSRKMNYVPFDGAGIWRGGTPRFSLWICPDGAEPKLVSRPGEEILWNAGTLTRAAFGAKRQNDVISGSWFGDIYYYRSSAAKNVPFEQRRHAVGEDGIVLRHPLAGVYPVAYPNSRTGFSDLIAGGEGGLYFYHFTGRFDSMGRPVFRQPVPVLEENARLFAGTLAVPTIVDWDGDGVLDLVAGNSEGRILFFRNLGSNRRPAMAPGVALRAGGREIHMQPGYKGDIQGPGEARWGYIGSNVFDWNGDGLPDILASDSTSRHYVFLNRGTRRVPALDLDRTLYLDGLDLHGTWRVRPGAGIMDGRVAYIALDDQDQFHRYWRLDDFNLTDGGKLHMEDGSPITANFLGAGGTGRSKIELVDWDGDGVMDLLVATPKHQSIPNPETGLPLALGLPGSTVLFLKNTGTDRGPRFRFPVVLRHKGERIYLGHHEIGASVGPLGPGKGPNLVVSRENGWLYFFQRENLEP